MERLSIEEIKEILNRDWNEMKAGYFCINDFRAIEQSMELLDELKAYRDAEEQGLILRLPCAIGSTIYKFEYPTIYDENGDGWTIIDKKRATVAPLKFALCHLDSIGKLYYLTREEAEQTLAEMQKG